MREYKEGIIGSEIVKASEQVIGIKVENMKGESLGKIEEIMLDKHTGRTRFVVLSFSEWMGIKNKLFAMPWELFSYHKDKECFVISVDKTLLQRLEGFDKDHWPNMADTTWSAPLYRHFGIKPATLSSRSDDRMQ